MECSPRCFGDVAVRPLPVDRRDVEEMVASLRGAALLTGARGRPKGDIKALVDMALSVASLAIACDGRLAELDLNPVVVREKGAGAVAVDSLVVLRGPGSETGETSISAGARDGAR